MTNKEIKEEALRLEKTTGIPESGKMRDFDGVNSAYGLGFCDGALWARRQGWISVKEKLPKKKEVVLIHCYPYGVITALFDDAWEGVEVPELFYSTDTVRQLNEVDYWMPIPELPRLVDKSSDNKENGQRTKSKTYCSKQS